MEIKISDCEVVEHPLFLDRNGAAFWCLHCERVSSGQDWRGNDYECPYDGCDGGALDMWVWDEDFEKGVIYPLFAFSV